MSLADISSTEDKNKENAKNTLIILFVLIFSPLIAQNIQLYAIDVRLNITISQIINSSQNLGYNKIFINLHINVTYGNFFCSTSRNLCFFNIISTIIFLILGGYIMRNVKVSTLLKVGVFFVLFSFMGCPNNAGGGQGDEVNNAPSQEDIKGDGPANETLKSTVWKTQALPNNMSEVELSFTDDSNTCIVNLPLSKKFYIAEYEVKENKVNLKLDKNIEFFKNFTVFNLLKGEENEMKEFVESLEESLKDPNMPETQKVALKKQIAIFKEAMKDGAFNTQAKFKKFSIEIMIPYIIKEMEKIISDPNVPDVTKNELKAQKAYMEAILKDNSLFDAYINNTVEEAKKLAPYLSNANPIVLTLPSGATLETATTMTANKMYVGVDNNNAPQYKENLKFTKQ